jgi:hypothetical protein
MKPAAADPQVLSEWQQSRHGQLQQAGDRRGAHCVSCHGAHGILPATDPRSTTHRRNVPATCGACHGDAEVMKGSAHGNRAVQDYLDGVHGQVLTGRRAGSADLVPTCVDCHGAHGPRPPEARSVPAVCGTCHFEIHRFMMLGPHRNALKHTGSPSCATCHGNHKNAVPHGERMAEVCLPCHKTTDDAGQAMARQIIAALDKTTRVAAGVRALVEHDGTRLATGSQQLLALQQERVEARLADLKKTIHLMDAGRAHERRR